MLGGGAVLLPWLWHVVDIHDTLFFVEKLSSSHASELPIDNLESFISRKLPSYKATDCSVDINSFIAPKLLLPDDDEVQMPFDQ